MTRLVLASQSPRRKVLLGYLTTEFDVDPTPVEEIAPRALPVWEALEVIARKKALATSHRRPMDWVLAADTVVVHRGELVGKARGPDQARDRLRALSGEVHEVVTGLALARHEQSIDSVSVTTRLRFDDLDDDLIHRYVRSEAWVGKAGGYGIQDAMLAPHLHIESGPWSNVVGLPLGATAQLLRRNRLQAQEPPSEDWLRQHNPFDAHAADPHEG